MDRLNPEARQLKKELLKGGYTRTKRMVEITWFVIFGLLFPLAVANIVQHLAWSNIAVVIAGLLCGVLFSDFMSGVVHWAADTWGSLEVPLFGPTFIRSFREHHLAPTAMCEHDVIETNGDTVMMTLPTMASLAWRDLLANSADGQLAASADMFSACFWLFTCIGVAFTNQFHKWSHAPSPPGWVEVLQRYWIVLPKSQHKTHHQPPFDGYYCITIGWLNPLLGTIRFWRGAEALISAVTGWVPREDDYKWTGLSEGLPEAVKRFLEAKQQTAKTE